MHALELRAHFAKTMRVNVCGEYESARPRRAR
jgi:hypothetical protein